VNTAIIETKQKTFLHRSVNVTKSLSVILKLINAEWGQY